MNFAFDPKRFSLAIRAREIMLYEKRTTSEEELNQRINEDVAKPTRAFLEAFAKSKPSQVICFTSAPFNFAKRKGCTCQDIYIFDNFQNVAYLGTAFNKSAMDLLVSRLPKDEQNDVRRRPEKIRRWHLFCSIPTKTNEVGTKELLGATKYYLQSCTPPANSLAQKTICFLSQEKGAELDLLICRQAKNQANRRLHQ